MTQTEYSELLKPSTANYADKRISSDVVQLIAQIKYSRIGGDVVQLMTQTEYSELLKPSTANCADKRIGGDVVQLIEYSELRG